MITDINEKVFDKEKIRKSFLIYAKHKSWEEGKAGIITRVTDHELTVRYLPGIGNVTNHFFLPADEIRRGEWLVRWSEDLLTIETVEGAEDEP